MTPKLAQPLREERGQTLVMFVLFLTGLVALLALSLDVGTWLSTHRKLQSVADAAALAAVQKGTYASIDDGWAQLDPPDLTFSAGGLPTSVTITASHTAPIIFGGVIGISAGFIEKATATAQAAPVSLITQNASGGFGPGQPYLTPIVVSENAFAAVCMTGSCYETPPVTFSYDTGGLGSGDFALANVCVTGTCNQPNGGTVRSWLRCQPACISAPTTSPVKIQDGFQIIRNGPTNGAQAALAQLAASRLPVIVSIVAGASPYQVVGFAELVITGVVSWTPQSRKLQGYFTTDQRLPASFGDGVGTQQPDYGVRAIGLTN